MQRPHVCVLQGVFSSRGGQIAPPNLAVRWTCRLRTLIPPFGASPPAQISEQCPNSSQSLTRQFTGQLCKLQERVWFRVGHLAPPCFGSRNILRVRTCVPCPHDWLHMSHSSHPETSQATGLSVHSCAPLTPFVHLQCTQVGDQFSHVVQDFAPSSLLNEPASQSTQCSAVFCR